RPLHLNPAHSAAVYTTCLNAGEDNVIRETMGGSASDSCQEPVVEVDILLATDLRFPGGNNASVVEEVRAQGRAGYRTALLHLPSPVQRSQRAFAPRIRNLVETGQARLILKEA